MAGWGFNPTANPEWTPPPPSQKKKLLEPLKGTLRSRPATVYCVTWTNGRTKIWFDKRPWEKLMDKVNAESWNDEDAGKGKPRFFIGLIDWWHEYGT